MPVLDRGRRYIVSTVRYSADILRFLLLDRLRHHMGVIDHKTTSFLHRIDNTYYVVIIVLLSLWMAMVIVFGDNVTGVWAYALACLPILIFFGPLILIISVYSLRGISDRLKKNYHARFLQRWSRDKWSYDNSWFPWDIAGICVLITLAASFFAASIVVFAILVLFMCIIVGLYLIYMFSIREGFGALPLGKAISADARAPVLYVRSFRRESDAFVEVEKGDYALLGIGPKLAFSLEQYLTDVITLVIGPFIALGSPQDSAPREGAARMYVADKNWERHFKILARRACCILMQVDESISLSWELGILRQENIHEKLFVLTRPASRNVYNHPIPWARFTSTLHALGYVLPDEDPGPGAVIVFNEQLMGVVVAKGAIFPDDFTGAIQKWRLHCGLIRPGEATSSADYAWGIERGQNGQFSRYVRRILRKRGADPDSVSEEEARDIVSRYESVRRVIRRIRLRRYEGEEIVPFNIT